MAVTTGSCSTNAPYGSRYLIFSWSLTSQSIADNTSTISWSVTGAGGGSGYYSSSDFDFVINGTTVYSADPSPRLNLYKGTVVKSGTTVIPHNEDGTKTFSASIAASIYYSRQTALGSGSWELPPISRIATITSAPDFTDEGNPTIEYVVPANDAITKVMACISLTGSADIAYREISKTGTSYTFNLTDAERNVLRNLTTTSTTKTASFYVRTYIGDDWYNNHVSKTLTIANCTPVISTATAVDTKELTLALTGSQDRIVKYSNTVVANMSPTLYKGATIVSQSITNGSNVVNSNTATFTNTSTATFVYTVTDSRGLTATKTVTKTLVDYARPTCELSVTPTTMSAATLMINGTFWNGNFGNSTNDVVVCQYRMKQDGGSYGDWIDISNPTKNGNSYSVIYNVDGLSIGSVYTFEARMGDRVFYVYSEAASSESFRGIQLFTSSGERAYPLCYFPIGAIFMSTSSTSPASIYGGEWTRIQDRFLIGAGGSYSVGVTGGAATVALTTDTMPSHSHTATSGTGSQGSGTRRNATRGTGSTTKTIYTDYTGSGTAHNNMPPYLVVYTWRRTA